MSKNNEIIENIANAEYQHGFESNIEQEFIPKGLNEDIIRLISAKKQEPEWLLEFRLKAFERWQKMEMPSWAHLDIPEIDYQDIIYYAAPQPKKEVTEIDPELAETFEKLGIPSIIMEPLLGGRLAKLPKHLAERLKERDPQKSAASWAFRFAGTPESVLTVLSGMTYMEHLQDNIKTYSPLDALDEKELAFLEETAELMQKYPTIPCNDCKYCMPCPYGIDIPAILLHYNKCVNAGEIGTSSQDEGYKKARRAYLVSYDRAVPKLRQADRCIGCNTCMAHCPQSINIPHEIHKISAYIEKLKRGTL